MIAFYSIYKIPLRLMIRLVRLLELTSLSHFSSKIYNFEGFKDRCPGGIQCSLRRWETYFYNRRFLTVSLIGVVFAMSDAITSLILFYTRELIATLPLKSSNYHTFTRKNIKNLVRMKTLDWTILLIRSIFTICNIVASHILNSRSGHALLSICGGVT